MTRRSSALLGWCSFAVFLLFTLTARAAEQGATPAEESPVGSVFKWIHFLIIVAATYWLLAKVLPPHVRRNADKIRAAINKATAAKVDAEKKLKEAAIKLASLEQEVARFREQAEKDAAAELERLRGMTKIDMDRVAIAAKAEIEAAERAARVELKALAARLAVDRAESLVAQQMTPAVQEAMIENFVQTLQGRPN
jgi:F0F1-type ATP synthase membrane subunit b/b'